ncbi:protein unc-93 homolog A [Trichonephila clavata]|uniref:Protein unc-93 homolog A n=1 Tax=Trichonephila clavata TaxID=2740835 RepID=A0A8X6FKH2_TRICU|nr:protein unc-93 homolog A [Trichonephila clavata]
MDKPVREHILSDVVEDLRQNPSINEDEDDLDLGDKSKTKRIRRSSLRNLIVFSVCYFLCYTGFWALSNLQSTMNAAGGLGDYSQAVIYIFSMISSLFLPKVLIDKFGCKNILVFGTLVCTFSIASNMFLRWDLMMTASVLFGLANGPFVAAQTYYIDEMATRFQSTIRGNMEFIMALFFGIFSIFSESTQISGNLLSYFILNPPPENVTHQTECGAEFIPSKNDTNQNLNPPSDFERHLLVGIYLGMALLSALILVIFLDPLKNDLKDGNGCKVIFERFASAFKHLQNPHQLLLLPLSVYIGLEGPFYGNEVTQV